MLTAILIAVDPLDPGHACVIRRMTSLTFGDSGASVARGTLLSASSDATRGGPMAPKSMLALLLSSLQDVLRVLAVAVAAFAMMAVVTVAFAPAG